MYKEFVPNIPVQYCQPKTTNSYKKRNPHVSMGNEPRWRDRQYETKVPGPGNYDISQFNSLESGSQRSFGGQDHNPVRKRVIMKRFEMIRKSNKGNH